MKNVKKWIILILISCIPLFFTETALFTHQIKLFFTITIASILLVCFDLTDSLIASIVLFLGYSIFEVADKSVIFLSWGNDMTWMLIGSLVLASILEQTGVMVRCSYFIICKTNGSYAKMIWGVYLAALFVAFLTSVTGFPLFATLVFGICSGLGYKLGSKEANGIVFAAMTGGIAPFAWIYNPINAGVGAAVVNLFDSSLNISWLSYLTTGLPWLLFDLIWMLLISHVFFRCKMNVDTAFFKAEYEKLGPVRPEEKKAVCLASLVVAYLIASSFLALPSSYAFMLLPWLAFLPGVKLGSDRVLRGINYSIVFFTVACLSIGSVGVGVGVDKFISNMVTPMLQGLSELGYVAGVWSIAAISNLLLTPVAVTTALGVPIMQIGIDLGIPPLASLFTILMNVSNVFMPHENTAYLMYFAFGLFTMKDFIKYNTIRMILHIIFMLLVIVPWWNLTGVM